MSTTTIKYRAVKKVSTRFRPIDSDKDKVGTICFFKKSDTTPCLILEWVSPDRVTILDLNTRIMFSRVFADRYFVDTENVHEVKFTTDV